MTHQKTLHIVRHGKSTWELTDVDDFDRPLTSRGISSNHIIASRFAASFGNVDSILTSPAVRALSTAVSLARTAGISLQKIKLEPHLYFSGVNEIITLIEATSNDIDSLMVVGHNPDLTDVANHFVPSITDEMPTSSIASIRFNIESWADISQRKVSEWFFDYPKKS